VTACQNASAGAAAPAGRSTNAVSHNSTVPAYDRCR
jgi:hypothetical protein